MPEWRMEEFEILYRYNNEMLRSLANKSPLARERLEYIGCHIQVCDHLIREQREKTLLFQTYDIWLECVRDRNDKFDFFELRTKREDDPDKDRGSLAVADKLSPEEVFEKNLTKDDWNFLKSLKVIKNKD